MNLPLPLALLLSACLIQASPFAGEQNNAESNFEDSYHQSGILPAGGGGGAGIMNAITPFVKGEFLEKAKGAMQKCGKLVDRKQLMSGLMGGMGGGGARKGRQVDNAELSESGFMENGRDRMESQINDAELYEDANAGHAILKREATMNILPTGGGAGGKKAPQKGGSGAGALGGIADKAKGLASKAGGALGKVAGKLGGAAGGALGGGGGAKGGRKGAQIRERRQVAGGKKGGAGGMGGMGGMIEKILPGIIEKFPCEAINCFAKEFGIDGPQKLTKEALQGLVGGNINGAAGKTASAMTGECFDQIGAKKDVCTAVKGIVSCELKKLVSNGGLTKLMGAVGGGMGGMLGQFGGGGAGAGASAKTG